MSSRFKSGRLKLRPLLIAITGYGQDDNRKNVLETGFYHYLVKPVDTKEIVALLAEHSEAIASGTVRERE
jgi:CheY-like chemotaxis protein